MPPKATFFQKDLSAVASGGSSLALPGQERQACQEDWYEESHLPRTISSKAD